MSTTTGTANEDRVELSKADSKAVRRRSVRLLRTLLRPVRRRFIITVVLVVLSQAAKVSGPLLIAYGIAVGAVFGAAQTLIVEQSQLRIFLLSDLVAKVVVSEHADRPSHFWIALEPKPAITARRAIHAG